MIDIYIDAEEDYTPNSTEPRIQPVKMNVFFESDHDRGRMARRSQTGILLYINSALIYWYTNQQNNIEISTFVLEFVAIHISL